ncbi:MAG: site-2 protease family protein [Bacilli bacterium]
MKSTFLILLIVLTHELGHVFFFVLFKIPVKKIIIYPFGGITYIDKKIHERIYKDVICSFGGIIFQIILLFLFKMLFANNLIVNSTFKLFCFYNKTIIFFNLLPIIPLDGSKILFAVLTKYMPFKTSYFMMLFVSIISLVLFFINNFVLKINDITIYLFLLIELYTTYKSFKYIYNRFLLERVMYDHYYDKIINKDLTYDKFMLNKYYYIKRGNTYKNEKKYLKESYFYNCSK